MRLWHKDLIDVLPDMQLRGQWRECCLIAKALHEGNLNHLLVNKVKQYPIEDFVLYCNDVWYECVLRGVRAKSKRVFQYFPDIEVATIDCDCIFDGWHDTRYLRQCLYNLEEKAMCGGIPMEQWQKIVDRYGVKFDLWGGV